MVKSIGKIYISNQLFILVFLGILALDTLLKLVLYNVLLFEHVYPIFGKAFYIYVTLNRSSSGSAMQYVLSSSVNLNLRLLCISFSYMLLGCYIALMKNVKLRSYLKILIGVALWIGLTIATNIIVASYSDVGISDRFISWFKIIGAICLIIACIYFSSHTLPKLIWVVALSCGVANLINHFYKPYYIIDYMYVRFLDRTIRLGVLNLADLLATVANIAIIIYIIALPFRKIYRLKTGKAV